MRSSRCRCSSAVCSRLSLPTRSSPTARHAMKPEMAWSRWSQERVQRIEGVLEQALPPTTEIPAMLHTAMRYAALGAGKPLSFPELQRMHRLKTGALIEASVALGVGCGAALSASESEALERYARAVGLAFQVIDDVLDVEGTAGTLGKSIGKDAEQG